MTKMPWITSCQERKLIRTVNPDSRAAESRNVVQQSMVAEVTKEVDTLNTRPKQQKPVKKEQDSKSKKLVNGMCYIHAK